jgi:hypothetical protein
MWDGEMLARRRSVRLTGALAGGVIGFALAYMPSAAAQQAATAEGGGGLQGIVVAPRPNGIASVELVNAPQAALSDLPENAAATMAEPKMPAPGLEGFIAGGIGSYGLKTVGGAVTVPLAGGRGLLRIEGYDAHTGTR